MGLTVTLPRYGAYGLFFSLFKKDPLPDGFFTVIHHVMKHNAKLKADSAVEGETIKDSVVRDTLTRMFEVQTNSTPLALQNLRTYIETVHHQGYSETLMESELASIHEHPHRRLCLKGVGSLVANAARRIVDWRPDLFDPSPLLHICAIVAQHNKVHSRVSISCQSYRF